MLAGQGIAEIQVYKRPRIAVLGGAVGNLIDRVLHGYVVDMFNLQFMDFAVFNVADIGISVGGVLLCVYVLFFWRKPEESAP